MRNDKLLRTKLFWLVSGLLLVVLVVHATKSTAQIGSSLVWRDVNPQTILASTGGTRIIKPRRFRTVALDTLGLRTLLARAPMEFTAAARGGGRIEVALPKPDGTVARFLTEESPVMEPALAAKFPMIKTYRAQGIDDPAATARFGITPYGFHALYGNYHPAGDRRRELRNQGRKPKPWSIAGNHDRNTARKEMNRIL